MAPKGFLRIHTSKGFRKLIEQDPDLTGQLVQTLALEAVKNAQADTGSIGAERARYDEKWQKSGVQAQPRPSRVEFLKAPGLPAVFVR